jgi:hypothetical protein
MLSGRFAQFMEALSIGLIIFGIFALCQSGSFSLYSNGFKFLVAGWLGMNIWSHRRPVRPRVAEGNPQVTIDGHPPIEVTVELSSPV